MFPDIKDQIKRLENEILEVYRNVVLPHWGKKLHGFPHTLYGYMTRSFSYIDLISAYWKGSEKDQSRRMISFMNEYIRNKNEENSVAIQFWRHKLMHTAWPRELQNKKTQKIYKWLLHWFEHLPKEQHFTFTETNDRKILNVGLVYLIKDIGNGLAQYKKALGESEELTRKYELHSKWLESNPYQDY